MVALTKKRALSFALIVLSVVSLLLITSCGGSSSATIDGVYLELNETDGVINEDVWYKLENGVWNNSDGRTGTYSVSGESIALLHTVNEEEKEFAIGEISGGNLKLTIGGEKAIYVRE